MSTANRDQRMVNLRAETGPEGYGMYWMILETIAEGMDESGRDFAELPELYWRQNLGVSSKKLRNFLGKAELFGCFSVEYREKTILIKCPKLLKYRDEHTRKLRSNSGATPEQEAEAELEVEEEKNTTLLSARETDADSGSAFSVVYDAGCAVSPTLATANTSPIRAWLTAGCDPALDAVPEIRRLSKRKPDIRSWGYFTQAVMDAHKTRTTPPPEGKNHGNQGKLPRHSGFGERDYTAGTEGFSV